MNFNNPNIPFPAQELTIAEQLAAIQDLNEELFALRHRHGEEVMAAIRNTNELLDEQLEDQKKIIEMLEEIRDENRGEEQVAVAREPNGVGAPGGASMGSSAGGAAPEGRRFVLNLTIRRDEAATTQSLQKPSVHLLQAQVPADIQLPIQNPSSSSAQNGGVQVAHGAPAVVGGGPIRLARTRRGPPKQDVVHKGKVVGKGQTIDPITGLYTRFSCTATSCPYTTESRQKMRSHYKIHDSKE